MTDMIQDSILAVEAGEGHIDKIEGADVLDQGSSATQHPMPRLARPALRLETSITMSALLAATGCRRSLTCNHMIL